MAKGSRRPQLNLYRRERCHQMETFEEDILGGWSGMNRNVDSYSVKCICICVHAKLLQSCPTLCDPRDCSLPDSSVHGILQARILEWVTTGDLPKPRIELVSLMSPALSPVLTGRFFTTSAT